MAMLKSHSHTLSFTLSRHAEQLLSSCLCSKVTVYSRKLQCFLAGNQLYDWQTHGVLTLTMMMRSKKALQFSVINSDF